MNNFFAKIFQPVCRAGDVFGFGQTGVPILLYHSISNNPSRLAVRPLEFRRQMAYLAQAGYEAIFPDEVKKALAAPGRKKYVVLTFDDGLLDNLTTAEPILTEYNFRATVFIAAKYIGGKSQYSRQPANQQFKMLSSADIRQLEKRGWLIANHFYSHRNLVDLTAAEIKQEFKRAYGILAEVVKNKRGLAIVSYPRNKYNSQVLKAARQAGAKIGLAGERNLASQKSNIMAWPRIEISKDIDLAKFKLYLSPSFYWLKNFIS